MDYLDAALAIWAKCEQLEDSNQVVGEETLETGERRRKKSPEPPAEPPVSAQRDAPPAKHEPPVIDGITVDEPDPAKMKAAVEEVLSEPGEDPEDWPASWWPDFDKKKAAYSRRGHVEGEAARLAYEDLKARARLRWRTTLARWPLERRQAWGERANALEAEGLPWDEAERRACAEVRSQGDTRWASPIPTPKPVPTLDDLVKRARRSGGTWVDPSVEDIDWNVDIRDYIVT